jgi:hypothetical protein
MYNLADIIRFKHAKGLNYEGSIAQEYLRNVSDEVSLDFRLLHQIIESRADDHEHDCIDIHMRLGDIVSMQQYSSLYDVVSVVKKYKLNTKYSKCRLFYGNHNKRNIELSNNILAETRDSLEALGLKSDIVSNSVDSDFIQLATSKCFIPTIKGFSWLAASINPHNVYWDLQTPPNFDWLLNTKFRQEVLDGYNYHLKIKSEASLG